MKINAAYIEKIGIVGIVITALTSPCCFPLFGVIVSAMGFGSMELFGEKAMLILLGFTFLSFIGSIFSYLYHKKLVTIVVSSFSAVLIYYSYFFEIETNNFIYLGMFGLMFSGIINYYETKLFKMRGEKFVELFSTITCPTCSHQKKEEMPTDACQFFYECENCKTQLKPKQGDCCVYCSYGSVPCPPIQEGKEDCCK